MKVRRKATETEAVQWTGTMSPESHALLAHVPMTLNNPGVQLAQMGSRDYRMVPGETELVLHLPGGDLKVYPGDWLLVDPEGRVYPVPDSVFWNLYEVVED